MKRGRIRAGPRESTEKGDGEGEEGRVMEEGGWRVGEVSG